jgi:hypothetical protein
VAGDCYCGVICLSGAGQMGENREDGTDDDYGAPFHKKFIFLGAFFVEGARRLQSSKTSMRRNSRRRAYSLTLVCRMRSTKP